MNYPDIYSRIRDAASLAELAVDTEVYMKSCKDSLDPITFAGNIDAAIAFLGRDLGATEVLEGEPLIGNAGRRVRRAVIEFFEHVNPHSSNRLMPEALNYAFLTNLVPYKPIGNKAFTIEVQELFRPFVEEILLTQWEGNHLFTLGTEAFFWFAKYAGKDRVDAHWSLDTRYSESLPLVITATVNGKQISRPLSVQPLPHPSPLNRIYFKQFPSLIKQALDKAVPISH